MTAAKSNPLLTQPDNELVSHHGRLCLLPGRETAGRVIDRFAVLESLRSLRRYATTMREGVILTSSQEDELQEMGTQPYKSLQGQQTGLLVGPVTDELIKAEG